MNQLRRGRGVGPPLPQTGRAPAPRERGTSRRTTPTITPVNTQHTLRATVLAVAQAACACQRTDPVRPIQHASGLVVTPGDNGAAYLIDTALTESTSIPLGTRATLAATPAPDRSIVYLSVLFPDAHRELIALRTRDASVVWREIVSGSTVQRTIGGVQVWGPDVMAATPNGSDLILGFAKKDSVQGLAALDVAARSSVRFAGPLVVRAGLGTVGASSRYPHGAVVAGGGRSSTDRRNWIYFLDSESLALVDSLAPDAISPSDTMTQVLPAPSGDALLIATRRSLIRFDLTAGRRTASTQNPTAGAMAVTADGSRLLVTDPGSFPEQPGSGRVSVFDVATLTPLGSIQLPPADDGQPRVSLNASAATGGPLIYLTTGTPSRGPLFGTQRPAILALDVQQMRVIHMFPLSDWSTNFAFAF